MAKPCPNREVLESLAAYRLHGVLKDETLHHLEQCDTCSRELETLLSGGSLFDLVRSSQEPVPLPTTVVDVMDRLMSWADKHECAAGPGGDPKTLLAPAKHPEDLGELGPYRVLEVLGQGGMGVVFRAYDPALERFVAVKTLRPELVFHARAKERFLREARAAALLKHPNIVTIHQVGEDRGIPYLAMEFLEGEPLDASLDGDKKLAAAEVIRIGRGIAEGLAAAHAHGLVHRDVKPANVWLESAGQVKILDFGLARAMAGEAQLTQQGGIVGTPAYMSPEQARGDAVDARSDLFSLGCLLFRCCTGQVPFKGADVLSTLSSLATRAPLAPHRTDPGVPRALSDLIVTLLAKDPQKRPASAMEVVRALDKIAQPVTTSSTPASVKWAIPAAFLVAVAWYFSGTIIRFANNQGELVVELHDPSIHIAVTQNDLVVEDKTANRRFLIKAGEGQVEVYEKDGIRLLTKEFALTRGGATTVRITISELQASRALAKKHIPPSRPSTGAKFALLFDGNTSRVRIPTLARNDDGPMTIEAYVVPHRRKPDTYTQQTVVTVGGRSTMALRQYGGLWRAGVRSPETQLLHESSAIISLGTRVHLAAVWNGKELSLFVNGERSLKEPREANIGVCPPGGSIGAQTREADPSASFAFEGTIDEVRISKVARYDRNFAPKARFESDADTLALYHCDEGQGDVLTDSSGNDRHGKIVGARWVDPAAAPPKQLATRGLEFDGNGLVELDTRLNYSPTSLTIEAYARPDAHAARAWIYGLPGNSGLGLSFEDGKRWRFSHVQRPGGHFQVQIDTEFELGRRVHVAGVCSEDRYYLFVDGRLVGKSVPVDGREFTLAKGGLDRIGQFFKGVIDEVRVSNKPRYTANFTPPVTHEADADTLALYRFDEGQGGVLKDSSGNGRHGRVVGAKWVLGDLERAGAEWVLLAGGKVVVGQGGKEWQITTAAELPSAAFEVRGVNLERTCDDADLAHLKGMTRLKVLRVMDVPIGDAGLAHIKGLTSLTELNLIQTRVTDAGLAHLGNLKALGRLVLNGTKVGDDGLARLQDLPSLFLLGLDATPITDAGLVHLKKLPNLNTLNLIRTEISDAGMAHLKGVTSLKWLNLTNTRVGDAGLRELHALKNLTAVQLHHTRVTADGVQQLKAALPGCRVDWEARTP